MNLQEVFTANRNSTSRMKQIVDRLSTTQLTSVLPNGWTVSVTLAHLAFWDQRVIRVIEMAKMEGKVTPSNFDDSLNDVLEPLLKAISPDKSASLAVEISSRLDKILEESTPELMEQLEAVNHRWVDRSLHRNDHLNDIESFLNK
jgi:hypothetical protein